MNILTFDIEDWYNCDFISENRNWGNYEVRIYAGVDRILDELEIKSQKATFFCLGWLAEMHPGVIRKINDAGHQIGCHSYNHQLSFKLSKDEFRTDTERATKLMEDVAGQKVSIFRAPGFSITQNNLWAFDVLSELGFDTDCSIFPATHDYGGFTSYGNAEPAKLLLRNGAVLKEFPMSVKRFAGKNVVFSGGGFFRLLPYSLIRHWAKSSPYMMTYFHPRDFDPEQPVLKELPLMRRFKSYVGLKNSFSKFQHFLNDFEFMSISEADKKIDWSHVREIRI